MQRQSRIWCIVGLFAIGTVAAGGVCHAQNTVPSGVVIIHQNGKTTVIKGGGTVVLDGGGNVTVKRRLQRGNLSAAGDSASGHQIILNSDGQHRSYECDNSTVVINSDRDMLILKGDCDEVVVNGDHDAVRVIGILRGVVQNGSRGVITWSKKLRQGTQIMDNGSGNSAAYKP